MVSGYIKDERVVMTLTEQSFDVKNLFAETEYITYTAFAKLNGELNTDVIKSPKFRTASGPASKFMSVEIHGPYPETK